mmetsp:Transcript_88469/g.245708  ORF Transcript_88469/g.245708 Transcript_88469/m.245708 type:complete len:224 (+) Transcript_88469:1982-2653(+)
MVSQPHAHCLYLAHRRCIDDRGLRVLRQMPRECPQVLLEATLLLGRDEKVWPVHGRHALKAALRDLAHAQRGADVFPNLRRGGGRERQQGHARHHLPEAAELTVGRPEVLAPLADAVGLIHSNCTEGLPCMERLDARLEAARGCLLRRHVDEEEVAVQRALLHAMDALGGAQEGRDLPALCIDGSHLILHQRYQRRDNNDCLARVQRGQLVAHGLACSSAPND